MSKVSSMNTTPNTTPKPTLMGFAGLLDNIPGIPKANRCPYGGCRGKLGLTAFPCKCGMTFCSKHRLCEDHECSYNFKMAGLIGLSTQLVKINGEKLKEKL